MCHEPWFSPITFGYIHLSGIGRILTAAHRTNSARTCNASRLQKRFTCIVRRRERSRGQDPSSEHFVTSIHICRILQKRANGILMPTSQLDFICNESERDVDIPAKGNDQAVLVVVSAPSSCHIPDKSPAGGTPSSPLLFLNSNLSRSMPSNVRTCDSNPNTISQSRPAHAHPQPRILPVLGADLH